MISKEKHYKVSRNNETFLKEFASKDGLKNYWKTNNITIIEPFHNEKAKEVISRKDVIDKTYDGSITPKTHIHETAAYLDKERSTFVTEYAYPNENKDDVQSHVVRFGINANKESVNKAKEEIEKYNQNIKQAIKDDLRDRASNTTQLADFIEKHQDVKIDKIIKDLKQNAIYPKSKKDKNDAQILEKLIKVFQNSFSKTEVKEYIQFLKQDSDNNKISDVKSDTKTNFTQTSVGSAIGNKNISKLVTHLSCEKAVINAALSTFEQNKNLKTILVDIYARNLETTLINNNDEIHTVVLYRPSESDKIFVIDPNNPLFSSHLSNFNNKLVTSYSDKIKIYNHHGNDTGNLSDEWRDCIDIAVKIGFALQPEATSPNKIKEVYQLKSIKQLSNIDLLNESLLDTMVNKKTHS